MNSPGTSPNTSRRTGATRSTLAIGIGRSARGAWLIGVAVACIAQHASAQKSMDELRALDAKQIAAMIAELSPSGAGDAATRQSLHGLMHLAAAPGQSGLRSKAIEALTASLATEKRPEIVPFLIEQLEIVGGSESQALLVKLLDDDRAFPFALRALLATSGAQAATAIREAHAKSSGDRRIALCAALGRIRDPLAVPTLLSDAEGKDEALQRAALSALASIGDVRAKAIFSQTVTEAARFDRNQRIAAALEYGRNLTRGGGRLEAAPIFRALFLKTGSNAQNIPARCAALAGLADALGAEAVTDVVNALIDENAEIRAAATEIAAGMSGTGVTDAFVSLLELPSTPIVVSVLNVLERRKDATALPAVLAAVRSTEKPIRMAAHATAAALGGDAAIDALVSALNTDQRDEVALIQKLLTRAALDGAMNKRLARGVGHANPRVRAGILPVLVNRRAASELDAIYSAMQDADELVRCAGIRAMGALDQPAAVSRLMPLLVDAKTQDEREALEFAITALCRKDSDPDKRTAPIMNAIRSADTTVYASQLRILGRLGGYDAYRSLTVAIRHARPEIRDAAYEAFADWPDAMQTRQLLDVAKQAEETRHQVLALRGFARLALADESRPPGETLAWLKEACDAAKRVDEQRLMLNKMGEVRDSGAIEVAAGYVSNAELRAEAASAILSVCERLLPGGWVAARAGLERVTALSELPDAVKERAQALGTRIAAFEDFVTEWRVSGPYRRDGKRGNELFDIEMGPELDGPKPEWRALAISTGASDFWRLNLASNPPAPNSAMYLLTYLISDKPQDVRFEMGSDDGIKAWVNGKVIHANNALRGCVAGDDKLKVHLDAGVNEVMLKVTDNGGGFAACLRVRAPDGQHAPGWRARVTRE